MSATKIMLGTLLCIVVAMIVIFIIGGVIEAAPTYGFLVSALVAMIALLLPLTELSAGSWVALVALVAGGFVGGLICANYRRAVVMAVLSVALIVILSMGLGYVVLTGLGLSITDLFSGLGAGDIVSLLLALLPDLLVAMGIIAVGGLLGAMVTMRRGRPPAYAPAPPPPVYAPSQPPPSAPVTTPTGYCPNCGAPISPGLVFCTNCGRKLQ